MPTPLIVDGGPTEEGAGLTAGERVDAKYEPAVDDRGAIGDWLAVEFSVGPLRMEGDKIGVPETTDAEVDVARGVVFVDDEDALLTVFVDGIIPGKACRTTFETGIPSTLTPLLSLAFEDTP